MKIRKSIVFGCLLLALSIILVSCKKEEKEQKPSQEVSGEVSEEVDKVPEVSEPENENPYAVAQN